MIDKNSIFIRSIVELLEAKEKWHSCGAPKTTNISILTEWLDQNISSMYFWDMSELTDMSRNRPVRDYHTEESKTIYFESADDMAYFKLTWF